MTYKNSKIMNVPIKHKRINRIIQTIPMVIFTGFVIYFFVNGNVGFHDHSKCETGIICLRDAFIFICVAATIIVYSIIFLFSCFFYSPKYSYVSFIFLILFIYNISDLQLNPSTATKRIDAIEYQTNRVKQFNMRTDPKGLNEKCRSLTGLAHMTKNIDYYFDAISSIDTAIKQDNCNYKLFKLKSDIYIKLAKFSNNSVYYTKAIQNLENFLISIDGIYLYSGLIKIIHKDIYEIYIEWAKQSENEEEILKAIAHLKKGDLKKYKYKPLYSKLYKLTSNQTYLHKELELYDLTSSDNLRVGNIYEELNDYANAISFYKKVLKRYQGSQYVKYSTKRQLAKKIRNLEAKHS